ncbi:hypothetical protein GCM10012289_08860 [Nonomuraea cavernae]|uniref:Uncharacterized protein n=1 Tax=Nonomuraea cavernae TaxID=2045107 RepID=A0A918DEX0_9ACTN|nr:hypothetical protein GCM10012289_08860 [Nonomuraea cavernae]
MSSERAILIALAAIAATAIAAALMLADGSTWPAALLTGLAAGGATLWGLLGWFARHSRP